MRVALILLPIITVCTLLMASDMAALSQTKLKEKTPAPAPAAQVPLRGTATTEAALEDVGVCTIPDAQGVEQLCIAVSGEVANDPKALERLGRLLGPVRVGGVFVVGVPQIPRTPTGKIQRALLKTVALDALTQARAI